MPKSLSDVGIITITRPGISTLSMKTLYSSLPKNAKVVDYSGGHISISCYSEDIVNVAEALHAWALGPVQPVK